jgi:hypothetical protein
MERSGNPAQRGCRVLQKAAVMKNKDSNRAKFSFTWTRFCQQIIKSICDFILSAGEPPKFSTKGIPVLTSRKNYILISDLVDIL